MSTTGIVISLIILAVAVIWVIAPLRRGRNLPSAALTAQEQLVAVYERVVARIRDLDEDFASGKLHEEDYTSERAALTERGVQILQALEAGKTEQAESGPIVDTELDRAIEAAIRRAAHAR
ncbi:MAG: c-type cytochrome biogenesis protein CcmI [Caldilineaceae bacterium]|nr:c-type cytochrome biogenesis protein CcmI [Caldilineaceae bacterium]